MSQPTLQRVLRITIEGPPLKKYDATRAVLAWHEDKVRRSNQKARTSHKNRRDTKKVIPIPTSEMSSTSSASIITDSEADNDTSYGNTQVTLQYRRGVAPYWGPGDPVPGAQFQ